MKSRERASQYIFGIDTKGSFVPTSNKCAVRKSPDESIIDEKVGAFMVRSRFCFSLNLDESCFYMPTGDGGEILPDIAMEGSVHMMHPKLAGQLWSKAYNAVNDDFRRLAELGVRQEGRIPGYEGATVVSWGPVPKRHEAEVKAICDRLDL